MKNASIDDKMNDSDHKVVNKKGIDLVHDIAKRMNDQFINSTFRKSSLVKVGGDLLAVSIPKEKTIRLISDNDQFLLDSLLINNKHKSLLLNKREKVKDEFIKNNLVVF